MARPINEIYEAMLARLQADANLSTILTSTSNTAIYRLILMIYAYCAHGVEVAYDYFLAEVNAIVETSRAHPSRWYVSMAKKFQYGYNLVTERDYYNNTGIAEDLIKASKVIAFASLVEEPVLRLKVATLIEGKLAQVPSVQMDAFRAYIVRIKDAGVKLRIGNSLLPTNITSSPPDLLKLKLRIKYNPLVLNAQGARRDGTNATPVPNSIDGYLQAIDFDGLFSLQKLVDAVQNVEGVIDLKVDVAQTKYGALPFTTIDIDFVPDGGYLKILPADLEITWIPA
jgi:hypothetical protein